MRIWMKTLTDKTMQNCDLQDEDTLHLVIRSLGG
jgi:hypothetical protein